MTTLHKFLMAGLLCLLSFTTANAASWAGATSEPESTKKIDGKIFYVLTKAEELAWFAARVNAGDTSLNAVLGNDIAVLEGTVSTSSYAWTPIGKDTINPFAGIFDGAGHTISGIYVTAAYSGVFGVVGKGGTVKNLNTGNGLVQSNKAGGIAGYNKGTIDSCSNAMTVSDAQYSGGIAGYNAGSISGCSNTGAIDNPSNPSTPSYSGSIAGWNAGCISGCSNTGAIHNASNPSTPSYSGGIAGWNAGSISDCGNTGAIEGYTILAASYSGGIAGWNAGGISDCGNTGTINNPSYSSYSGG